MAQYHITSFNFQLIVSKYDNIYMAYYESVGKDSPIVHQQPFLDCCSVDSFLS